ncbi:hypothetical protein CspeluHIS016_0111430 [Cutaneotrichosporon spelunceum]|uniref:Uncharacterized protein n=1 Tax=Cutaneotrichosporon spelunceum TaxID=1672016 RepID=A0AAD3TPS5_9TREE|nr:hypothetical protein CspeluHIS016_0111430 [Cutaneotrichosporon spelunceum]
MDEAQHDRRVRRCFCRKPWLATWRVRPGHGRYADTLAADLAVGHWYNDEDAESEANGGEEGVEPDDSEASVEGDSEDDDEDADGEADDDEASVEGYSDGDETSVEGDSEDDEASAEGDDDITAVLYALFLADVELGDKVARRAALLVLEAVLWLYEQDKLFATLRELKVDRALPFSDGQRWDIEKQFNLRV